jgi:hypothetical protein
MKLAAQLIAGHNVAMEHVHASGYQHLGSLLPCCEIGSTSLHADTAASLIIHSHRP